MPFECRRGPGIIGLNFLAVVDAPEKVADKHKLRQRQADRSPEDIMMHLHGRVAKTTYQVRLLCQGILRAAIRHPL